ncbi:hypothetical protein QFC21_004517 [Naganishia friedmannii]|uniref:Uncharacterized protein n=1 Tax=Naganishia friedmannii TaxID=89922 RepID=A0ACC2VGC4_9TREE|nr:hypothetical protein QFC21_004517 [Naganishia friedmannii]
MAPNPMSSVPSANYDFSNFPMDQSLGDMSGLGQIDFGGSFLGTQFVEGFMDLNFVNGSMQNMVNPSGNLDASWMPMEFPQDNVPQNTMR